MSTARKISGTQSLPVADTPDGIYFVGDSITLGWRDEDLGGWPARLMKGLTNAGYDITGYNLGIRGDSSREIVERWEDEVRRRRRGSNPLLVFAFGVNDAKVEPDGRRSTDVGEAAANLRRILHAASRYRILLVGPTPIDEAHMRRCLNAEGRLAMPTAQSIADVADHMAREASAAGVPYLDLLAPLSSSAVWRKSLADTDGLHPSGAGHDIIAGQIQAWPAWSSLFPDR